MKTLIKTLLIGITSTLILSGCAGSSQPLPPKTTKTENGVILIQAKAPKVADDSLSTKEKIALRYENDLRLSFKKASEYTLKNGYTHFVIVNRANNHLKGFPLTSFKDISDYCLADYRTDDELKGKCGFMRGVSKIRTQLKIIPVKNPSYLFSSIDASEMLEEIK